MKRIRMFIVGLAALFALGATSLVVASPALAKCNAECKQHKHEAKQKKHEEKAKKKKERAEKKKGALEAKLKQDEEELAKLAAEKKTAEEKGETKVREEIARREAEIRAEKERLEKAQKELEQHEREAGAFWSKFGHCPINHPAENVTVEAGTVAEHVEAELPAMSESICFWGHTNGSSEFKAGNVKVPLTNPLTLQGGLVIATNEPRALETEDGDYLETVAPEDGTPELSPVAQAGPPLPDDVDAELLSPKEKALYNEALEGGSLSTTVTIELAAEHAYDVLTNVGNLLYDEGPAFVMPVKVKLGGELVGEHCYVGSNEHPIWVYLTTGQSGSLHGGWETLRGEEEGEILTVVGSQLVENTFASPGVEGCGGDASVDEAMDAALGLPSAEGNLAKINGTLSIDSASTEKERLEKYHIPVT